MDSELPNRQSIRLKEWDYTTPGWYFVTFNTHGGKALFGTVVNGRLVLNEAGRIAEEEWRKSAAIRRNLELDEFVIMPNHVHGLVRIMADAGKSGLGKGLDASSPPGDLASELLGCDCAGGEGVGEYPAVYPA